MNNKSPDFPGTKWINKSRDISLIYKKIIQKGEYGSSLSFYMYQIKSPFLKSFSKMGWLKKC